ncbi:MAG: hypothetical protein KUF77_13675 [Candidatus Thiodiazotropha sp. (ex Lucina aurantia)]|nr:hypothetical protein [Candidatus Thiodiazotropha taylori]MBV2099311.1 hypothetical protein [Candidatus Thiodiazotropha sp. (ex Codakia orbicularis)]MBV2104069.1 hypothetical protein [Candidatus Thiodiazotropha sp. (ex Lucina aurantia)]MBV2118504.1 hypothetical protein [Candidatus Thiodiazotropha sp. (ex Lucina aurantia)]
MDSLNKSLPGEDHFTDMDGLTIELALSFMLEDTGILLNEEVEADELFNGEVEKTLAIHFGILVVNLPERERLIIRNHYFHGVAFGDLANPLKISKGRISQLHKRALQKNRRYVMSQRLDKQFLRQIRQLIPHKTYRLLMADCH